MNKTNRLLFFQSLSRLVVIVGVLLFPVLKGFTTAGPAFAGSAALADTRRAVSFGERPSGSAENARCRAWILGELKPLGGRIELDSFTGQTPNGPVPMTNIVVRFDGTTGKSLVVTGHFDTKKIPMVHFVGANDGASSTGFLLEFARVAAKLRHRDELVVVFFDGEEAVGNWTDADSCYGSRQLAAKWLADGTLGHVKALINVDMIGDKDLDVLNDQNSSAALRDEVQKIAVRLGDAKYFRREMSGIEDDHKPFGEAGANVIDLIDFDYGPNNSYWHSEQDTLDKLSARSLQVVGDVVVELVKRLDSHD